MAENAQRAAGMKVGGNQEPAPNGLIREIVRDVLSLGSSRKAPNRANADGRRTGKALDVPLRKLNLHRIVNLCLRRNVNYHARSEPLIQEFQRMRGAAIRLTRQHHDDVGGFGGVNDQNSSRVSGEQSAAGEKDQYDNPSSSSDARVHEERSTTLSQFGHSRICMFLQVEARGFCMLELRFHAVDLAVVWEFL